MSGALNATPGTGAAERNQLLEARIDTVEHDGDYGLVDAEWIGHANREPGVSLAGLAGQFRKIFPSMPARRQEKGMEKDLAHTRGGAGIQRLGDSRLGDLEVRRVYRPVRSQYPHARGQVLQLGVGLGTPAAVIHE